MANINSTSGYFNLPNQVISTGTATTILSPATGLYGTLPSPLYPTGSALVLSAADWDVTNPNTNPQLTQAFASTYDGHPFSVRLVGTATAASTYTLIVKLVLGTNSVIGTSPNLLLATGATYTFGGAGTVNFEYTFNFLWDSTSGDVNGYFNGLVNSTFTATAATTQATAQTVQTLNFLPFFTFGTASAGNSVRVTEFLLNRE